MVYYDSMDYLVSQSTLCSQNKFKDSVREKYLRHNDQAFFIINWYMENVNDSMR